MTVCVLFEYIRVTVLCVCICLCVFCMCVCVCVCVCVCACVCFLETHNFIVLLDSDMAYVISFAEDTYDFNPSAILVSGIQKIWQSSCVRFEFLFRRNVTFLIRVPKCVTATTNDGILFTVHKNLGDAWHNVWLPLGIVGSVCDAQLQFEIVYDATYDYRSNVCSRKCDCFERQLHR